jgi:hypothetical protein
VRDGQELFGPVASDSSAFRVIDRIACEALLGALRGAHARARERFCELAWMTPGTARRAAAAGERRENTAADHQAALDLVVAQVPAR